MNTLNIQFELPRMALAQTGLDLDNISRDVKQMFAIFLYEHKKISLSKACEIGGMTQWEFFEMNKTVKTPIHYNKEDLKNDMEKLADV